MSGRSGVFGGVLGGAGEDYPVVQDPGAAITGDLVVGPCAGTGTRAGRPWLRFDAVEDVVTPS
jgi:hypothetical protein